MLVLNKDMSCERGTNKGDMLAQLAISSPLNAGASAFAWMPHACGRCMKVLT